MRPIIEMQFGDFVTDAFTQIIYNAAKMHYRSGLAVPLVIRMPIGGGMGAGPFHSANPEAWFAHVPGLKVVVPSNPADAYGLLRSAIEDPNPVIFVEHKALYGVKGPFPDAPVAVPLGIFSTNPTSPTTLALAPRRASVCITPATTPAPP